MMLTVYTNWTTSQDLFAWKSTFFLFLKENICSGYSLEACQWGTSNEFPQHKFSLRNKNIYLIIWIFFLARAIKSLSQDK